MGMILSLWPLVRGSSARTRRRRPDPPEPRRVELGPARPALVASPRRGLGRPPEAPDWREAMEEVLDEFSNLWESGHQPRSENYFERVPCRDPEDLVELVFHEYVLAESAGLNPQPADFLARFPAQRRRLARLFELDGVVSQVQREYRAGEHVGAYRLVRELGRGSASQVFLAEQTDLANRLVVLKLSTQASREPSLLARARHSHIVEVLSTAWIASRQLHLLCLPFLGGATLSDTIAERYRRGRLWNSGRALLEDMDRVAAPEYPVAGGFRRSHTREPPAALRAQGRGLADRPPRRGSRPRPGPRHHARRPEALQRPPGRRWPAPLI